MISILDYDMANLRSVQKALEAVGHPARIIRQPEEVDHADRLILPGVGAFGDCVRILRERHLDSAVTRFAASGKPLLGICVGMQVLFDTGYEDGTHAGLGLVRGEVVRFTVDSTHRLKIPHMGWNTLRFQSPSPIFCNLPQDSHVYFVHSYHCVATDPRTIAATTDYGIPFVASIVQDNLTATQFHPEKSQQVGLTILKNFAEL
jgi:glutamine amidotransferase